MSSGPNHRRGEKRRQDNGPTWENRTPAKGCNSTHVARARSAWKKLHARQMRRTGRTTYPWGHKRVEIGIEDWNEELLEAE